MRQFRCSLNTHSEPPCSRKFTRRATSPPHSGTAPPQPVVTAIICSPSCSQVTGGATIPVSGEGFTRTHRYVWTNSPAPAAPFTNWTTAAHAIQDALEQMARPEVEDDEAETETATAQPANTAENDA